MPETVPTEDEVLAWFESLSNWGRWGPADQLGTLNLVTDEKRRAAAGLVRRGRAVSCAWDIDTSEHPDDAGTAPRRLMVTTGQGLADPARVLAPGQESHPRHAGAAEQISLYPHGFRLTHLDALAHQFWDGRMYNGRPAELVTAAQGATELDISALRHGIVTRGVLVDAAAHRGVDWLAPREGVRPEELDAFLEAHDLTVEPGDAILLRTGYGAKVAAQGQDRIRETGRAGWHAACLPWLREHDVALIGTDTSTDASPSGYPAVRNPVHLVGIVAMGLSVLDNCNLEALAATCAELGTWEFQFVLAPLAFAGATGSPANPLAIL
ncbi:cyclase family protein [Amycolatopsis rhabdoformis]|uniref:Cyclase family protein n=1 Tax=Amycolatopsis rhabdoformis TaxID=1448059 RepID=A0ABZ1ICG4_9PSEU|nr:cyclase family protein [Amycolatopsis rhabdoformis]WSE31897.1 cyclase family protein [Amycolatopsis rhabdoformis]